MLINSNFVAPYHIINFKNYQKIFYSFNSSIKTLRVNNKQFIFILVQSKALLSFFFTSKTTTVRQLISNDFESVQLQQHQYIFAENTSTQVSIANEAFSSIAIKCRTSEICYDFHSTRVSILHTSTNVYIFRYNCAVIL